MHYYGARYYDPKSSVFLGVDPLADKSPNESPYVYCKNNPVILVDPDGRSADNFIINEDGVVTNIEKNNDPHRLILQTKEDQRVELFLNDPKNDRKQLSTFKEGDKAVTFVSDEDINGIMKESDISKESIPNRNYTAVSQPLNSMDFGVRYLGGNPAKDNSGGFVAFGNKNSAYNLLDGGNFLWGQAMKRLGFSVSTSLMGAQVYQGLHDSPTDQQAISDGFIYNIITNGASCNYKYNGVKR